MSYKVKCQGEECGKIFYHSTPHVDKPNCKKFCEDCIVKKRREQQRRYHARKKFKQQMDNTSW